MTSIQFSPFTAIFENKAAGSLITGSPGSGKSFFMLNLLANACLTSQRIFAIDPKNDLGVLADIFPEVNYIDINNIQPGGLNPFIVIDNLDTNTLVSIIATICGGLDNKDIIAITPIINDFINKNRRYSDTPCFADVANYLYSNDNEQAQAIGTALKMNEDSEYGPLLFGRSKTAVKFNNNSQIISLLGMDLPKANDSHYNQEQKFNSGIVFILCKILRNLLANNKYPTLMCLDEAHIAFQNQAFQDIINDFLVLGRSLNVATLLASQNVTHFPESIAQLISSRFCFKSSNNEAREFLRLFNNQNADNSADYDSIISAIGDFSTGTCFYIDSCNRNGIFHVTSNLGDDVTSNPLFKKRKNKSE